MKIEVRYFSWLLFLSITLTMAQPVFAQEEAAGGEEYTVEKGDTLWDISASKLENPFSWSRIWKQNPDIKDPDLIYPGEKITLPPGAVLKKTGEGAETAETAGAVESSAPAPNHGSSAAPFVEKGKTILKAPSSGGKIISLDTEEQKIPVATASEIMSAGFIWADIKGVREITGDAFGGRNVYTLGDRLYLDVDGVSVGDIFLMGKTAGKVSDPDSGEKLGKLIHPTGSLRIIERVDGKMVGVVENAFTAIEADDLVIPYAQPQLAYEPVSPNAGLSGRFGYVAAVKEEKITGSIGDIVYIDMGSDMGVKPGDRFVIRRSGDKGTLTGSMGYTSPADYVVPDSVVGEVVVLSVQPKTSTAKVEKFNEILRPGYRAVYKD